MKKILSKNNTYKLTLVLAAAFVAMPALDKYLYDIIFSWTKWL